MYKFGILKRNALAFSNLISESVFMSVNYSLLKRKNWIFDLDGTLTVAVHDFDAIRKELGIPAGLPIVETRFDISHPIPSG